MMAGRQSSTCAGATSSAPFSAAFGRALCLVMLGIVLQVLTTYPKTVSARNVPLPSSPPAANFNAANNRTVIMSIRTQVTPALTGFHCALLVSIADQAKPASVNVIAGPTCQLNIPPTTGANVAVELANKDQALLYFNAFASQTTTDKVFRSIPVPCNLTSINFTANGVASPRVFRKPSTGC